jgi:iron complex outermembrane receptor protein
MFALIAAMLVGAPSVGHADPLPADAEADVAFTVGELVVTALPFGARAEDLFTSVDVLGGDVVQRQNIDNAWELFGRLPGVLLTDFNQGTTSGRFSIRGFNGEGEINAVKLLIDGVPSNTNDGAIAYLDAVFPLEITSAETVRGTIDARYGLNNIAGDASITTRNGGTYAEARLGYGGWNAREAQAAVGLETPQFTQNYFAGWRQSDGYRDHADLTRRALSAKWGLRTPDGSARFGVSARYYHVVAQEPGYLTRADARATPRRSYPISETDGGRRTIEQYAAHYDGTPAEGLSADAAVYWNRFNDTRYVRFSAAVPQQERIAHERQWGALANLRYELPSGPFYAAALALGADMQVQDVRSLRYLDVRRVRTAQTRDQIYGLDSRGAYVKLSIEPTAALKLIPAYRVDTLDGDYRDRLGGLTAKANDYGLIGQPKFSAIWTPRPDLMAYGNWGRTFQVGAGSGAYKIPPRIADLRPSINDGWEIGAKLTRADRLEARLAYWEQSASGEVKRKLNDPTGDSENLGRTKRRGLDLQVSYAVTPHVRAWGALTLQRAIIEEPDPATPAAKGKSIDHVPSRLVAGGVDWNATDKLTVSASVNAQNDYYLEQTNTTGRFGGYVLANLDAAYAVSPHAEIQIQIKNLTDEPYEYVWWDGTQSLHSPGDRRALYAALMVRF